MPITKTKIQIAKIQKYTLQKKKNTQAQWLGAAKHTVVRDAWCQVHSLTSRQHDLYHGSSLSISDHYHYPNQQLNYLISLTKYGHGTTIISVFYFRFFSPDWVQKIGSFTLDDNDNHDNEADNKKKQQKTTNNNKRQQKGRQGPWRWQQWQQGQGPKLHTLYLSFFLHSQFFWRIKSTPKNANFSRYICKKCQFFALNL